MIDDLHLTANAKKLLASINTRSEKEQTKDFLIDTPIRHDIFTRGARELNTSEKWERLQHTSLILTTLSPDIILEIQGSLGKAKLSETIYKPLIQFLASERYQAKSIQAIQAALPQITLTQLLESIKVLMSLHYILPCQPLEIVQQVKAKTHRLNLAICRNSLLNNQTEVVVSPVTGTGIYADKITKLFLLAAIAKHNDLSQFVWSRLQKNNERIHNAQGEVLDDDNALLLLRQQYDTVIMPKLILLAALGILNP